jgi:hypothetical protein
MKALILNNQVADLSEKEFPVHPNLFWMDAPEGCQNGWLLEDGQLVEPAPIVVIEPPKSELELRVEALVKAVLDNDKSELEALEQSGGG